jgi:hypothetical protein
MRDVRYDIYYDEEYDDIECVDIALRNDGLFVKIPIEGTPYEYAEMIWALKGLVGSNREERHRYIRSYINGEEFGFTYNGKWYCMRPDPPESRAAVAAFIAGGPTEEEQSTEKYDKLPEHVKITDFFTNSILLNGGEDLLEAAKWLWGEMMQGENGPLRKAVLDAWKAGKPYEYYYKGRPALFSVFDPEDIPFSMS